MNWIVCNGLVGKRWATDAIKTLALKALAIDRRGSAGLGMERPPFNGLVIAGRAAGRAGTGRTSAQPMAINLARKGRPVRAMPDMADPWSIPEPGAPGWQPNVAAQGRQTSRNRYR